MTFYTKNKKKILIGFAILLIVWNIFLFSVDFESLAELIGLNNIYLILFLVAVTSGTSFLTSAAFYAVYLSYVSAGLDILMIAVISGLGMSIGDSIYFLFSQKAGEALNENRSKLYKKIYRFFMKLPRWGVYLFAYLYISFAPIPNDILMVILGAMRYKFRYIVPLLILGNITLLILIAYGINLTLF